MVRKYVLPTLALSGVLFGVFMVKQGMNKPQVCAARGAAVLCRIPRGSGGRGTD